MGRKEGDNGGFASLASAGTYGGGLEERRGRGEARGEGPGELEGLATVNSLALVTIDPSWDSGGVSLVPRGDLGGVPGGDWEGVLSAE